MRELVQRHLAVVVVLVPMVVVPLEGVAVVPMALAVLVQRVVRMQVWLIVAKDSVSVESVVLVELEQMVFAPEGVAVVPKFVLWVGQNLGAQWAEALEWRWGVLELGCLAPILDVVLVLLQSVLETSPRFCHV